MESSERHLNRKARRSPSRLEAGDRFVTSVLYDSEI
jgi:hypothetical protein